MALSTFSFKTSKGDLGSKLRPWRRSWGLSAEDFPDASEGEIVALRAADVTPNFEIGVALPFRRLDTSASETPEKFPDAKLFKIVSILSVTNNTFIDLSIDEMDPGSCLENIENCRLKIGSVLDYGNRNYQELITLGDTKIWNNYFHILNEKLTTTQSALLPNRTVQNTLAVHVSDSLLGKNRDTTWLRYSWFY